MKRLFAALFVVCLFASTALAVDLYDGEGNRIGEVVSKGMLDQGKWGVQVFVESLGKFARIAPINHLYADVIDPVPHGWGMFTSDSIGVWEGIYFVSGQEQYRYSDMFLVEYCLQCANIFPIKLPLRYEVGN